MSDDNLNLSPGTHMKQKERHDAMMLSSDLHVYVVHHDPIIYAQYNKIKKLRSIQKDPSITWRGKHPSGKAICSIHYRRVC